MSVTPSGARRALIAVLVAAAATAVAGSPAHSAEPAAAPECAPGVDFLGFTDALNKTTFEGTNVGGLSALAYDRRSGLYESLVDNERDTPARAYALRLPFAGGRLGAARVLDATTLRKADDTPFTGADFDGEGLVLEKRGLLAASETEPSIRRFTRSGTLVDELPVPARFRVAPAGQATTNQTFESLSLAPGGGDLFTALEGPLSADKAPTDTADTPPRLRILRYDGDRRGGYEPAEQFYYRAEAGQGVTEVLALGDDDLLVLERGFVAGQGNTVKVWRATLRGAPDVADEPTLTAAGLRPVYKRLVVDLASCPASGATNPGTQANPLLDNFEGLALGPPRPGGKQTLLLQSDDNFGAGQVTRIVALGVALPKPGVLRGRAVLPSSTQAEGPPSGAAIGAGPFNGVTPPFAKQPVQGFSAILDAGGGAYYAMPDNGFGAKDNSADFLLRVYKIKPDFETARGGSGEIAVESFISLRDPDRKISFPIVRGAGDRLLTGGDFDIESVRRDPKTGDLWFGDEFGPFLLRTDATGRVLEEPFGLPGVKSPQNPTLGPGEQPTLGRSSGFEGMAISPDGRTLYPMLEGALTADTDPRRRIISTFDIGSRAYKDTRYSYRTEAPGYAIGDLTALDANRLLVIERDNEQGVAARFKRVYVIDLRHTDDKGFVRKRELLDLLNLRDPDGISEPGRTGDIGLGDPFQFPFQTIESVLPLGGNRLLILNDNNYPFSAGRNPTLPDDNEAIVVRVPGLR